MFRKLFIFFSSFLENEGPLSSSKANKVKTNKYGESALHVAIKKGDYEKAKSLIDESDADVNMKDNAGEFSTSIWILLRWKRLCKNTMFYLKTPT